MTKSGLIGAGKGGVTTLLSMKGLYKDERCCLFTPSLRCAELDASESATASHPDVNGRPVAIERAWQTVRKRAGLGRQRRGFLGHGRPASFRSRRCPCRE